MIKGNWIYENATRGIQLIRPPSGRKHAETSSTRSQGSACWRLVRR